MAASAPSAPQSALPPAPNPASRWRRLGLWAIFIAILIGAALYAWWWYQYGQRYITTDNAYVSGNLIQLTSQTPGTVLSIHANETDRVIAGQTLVALDPTDARLAYDEAQSALARAVRDLQTAFAEDGHLRAQVGLREAELNRARSERSRADGDLARRKAMAASGAISEEDLRHAEAAAATARSSVAMAEAALDSARESRQASRILVEGTTVENHPSVQRALTALRTAHVALRRATVAAPVSAHVARRSVQVGQRVAAGAALMTLVTLEDVWVDANFKESQLRGLRIGQPARLTADVYGDEVVYPGHVIGLAAGTGSAFALLPAQNATGNWIKVVQRVPVRIALDERELQAHPLRSGLSMQATIDTRDFR